MGKKNKTQEKDSNLSESENKSLKSAARSKKDKANDPLFVPHFEANEIATNSLEFGSDPYAAMIESICGVMDDSQPVEQYDGTLGVTTEFVATHQSAACQVQWNNNLSSIYTNAGNVSGVRWGSGTMITNDLLLTCGHLFDQTGGGWERPRTNGTSNIITPQEIARNMRVNFNYQVDAAGNLRSEQSFAITELIEYRLGGLDMALCRISGNPGASYGRAVVSSADAVMNEMICIIGHPAGQPKRIEAGPTTDITGNLILYNDIDTLGGNSGSGILRASDGRLVGIHTNGGCTSSSPAGGGSNFGQRIAAVIAASPTLQALLRPKLKFVDDKVDKLKVIDDPKLKFVDDGGKFKVIDDRKLKFRDDVKSPALDKQPGTDSKLPGFDFPGGFDPGRPRNQAQSTRPFILSTPHHSYAWQGGARQENQQHNEIGAMLLQYEQNIASLESELQQLNIEYRELLVYYQSLEQGGQIT